MSEAIDVRVNAVADHTAYFDGLYSASADPYSVASRWYEIRKRAILLATLPRQRYRSAYEPGCGTGHLTTELAGRCDRLLASDFSAPALALAQARLAGLTNVHNGPGNVTLERHVLPGDWPKGDKRFDLIVFSEIGYFLDAESMRLVAGHCAASLDDDGTLVACDWRPPFEQRSLATVEVHAALAAIGLTHLACHIEDDFSLQVWTADRRTVAQREGIR